MFRFPNFFILVILSIFFFSCEKSKSKAHFSTTTSSKAVTDTLFRHKADNFYNQQKYDSAFLFYNKFKTIAESSQDTANVCYSMLKIAETQLKIGDYAEAESSLVDALKITKEKDVYKASIYNLLGISAKELRNFDDAIKYYELTKKFSDDFLAHLTADNNIGAILIEQKKYKNSIVIFEKILKSNLLNKPDNIVRKARVLDNLGYAYFKNKDIEIGLKKMLKGLQIRLEKKDFYGSIQSNLHLADFYSEKDKKLSVEYALKAYKEATKLNSIDERIEALLFLINADFKRKYVSKYTSLSDSITKIRNSSKNQFAKIKYDARMAREENLKLKNTQIQTELELEKSESEKDFWLIVATLLVSFVFFLVNYFKNKNRIEKQKATYLTETRIAKKIHDELANDVFQTISFVETKTVDEPQNKEELINLLDNLYQRSRNISKENESIETGQHYSEILIDMMQRYKTQQRNVIIKKDETIDWQTLSDIKKITLFRVLQELFVNMKKHSQSSLVLVTFSNDKKNIQVDYADNGKGFDMDKIQKGGLNNVENRIQNINGKIIFDTSAKGLKVKITISK